MTYTEMVAKLFKRDDNPIVMMVHAAIGIAGESGELRAATARENSLEECGDMLFYIEALIQQLPSMPNNFETLEGPDSPITHATVVDNIHILSSEILDTIKKTWVYGRDLKELVLWDLLETLSDNVEYYITEVAGSTLQEVMNSNMQKLLTKRYATGSYSDEQALARKDKQ